MSGKPHKRHRLRQLTIFTILAFLVTGAIFYRNYTLRQSLDSQIAGLKSQADSLAADITFGTLDDQDVDSFILNLKHQIATLELRNQYNQIILDNAHLFSIREVEEATVAIEQNNQLLQKYYQEREFMALAWLDYNVFRQDPKSLDLYVDFIKNTNQLNYSVQKALAGLEPVYVHTGQVIGMQGCTGVCTGTHIHFVTTVDGKVVDPCTLLPLTPLTMWGSTNVCGTAANKLEWPFYLPWIISQEYGVTSPVIHTMHDALDIIDREFAPVLAAHDGWLYSEKKDCTGAVICNSGAANIVTICEQKDCRAGLKTEYWHLAWMVE